MQSLRCSRCARTFECNPTYTDLTVTSGTQQRVFSQQSTAGREIFRCSQIRRHRRASCCFPAQMSQSQAPSSKLSGHRWACRSPIVSFVYERGWRQGFSWAGFPGAFRAFAHGLWIAGTDQIFLCNT